MKRLSRREPPDGLLLHIARATQDSGLYLPPDGAAVLSAWESRLYWRRLMSFTARRSRQYRATVEAWSAA